MMRDADRKPIRWKHKVSDGGFEMSRSDSRGPPMACSGRFTAVLFSLLFSTGAVVYAGDWRDLPESFGPAWDDLVGDYPGLLCTFNGGRVGLVYGRTMCGGETIEGSAENFLEEYIGLLGLSRGDLVLDRVVDPPASGGPAYVRYEQFHDGVPVEGASITLVISSGAGHAVKRLSNRCHPSPGAYLREDIVSEEEAREVVVGRCGRAPNFYGEAAKVIWPRGECPAYAWRIDASEHDRDRAEDRFFVSTYDGEVLDRRDLIYHFDNFTITVQGMKTEDDLVPPDCPEMECPDDETTIAVDLGRIKVDLEETTPFCFPNCATDSGYANEDGDFEFIDVPPEFQITATMESEYFYLYDFGSPNDPYTEVNEWTDEDGSGTLTFDDICEVRERTTEQVNVYYWLHYARQWVEDLHSDYPGIDTQAEVTCNTTKCSAEYDPETDPPSFEFGNSNTLPFDQCICGGPPNIYYKSLHSATVIAHEYGHHVHYSGAPAITGGTWAEAIADAFSSFVVGNSELGKDLCNCAGEGDLGRDINDDSCIST